MKRLSLQIYNLKNMRVYTRDNSGDIAQGYFRSGCRDIYMDVWVCIVQIFDFGSDFV